MKKVTIEGIQYTATMPQHDHDMNFHFVNDDEDVLVDLEDVISFINQFEHKNATSATLDDAIEYAKYTAETGSDGMFGWKVNERR